MVAMQEPAQRLDRVDTRRDRAAVARDGDDNLSALGPCGTAEEVGRGDKRVALIFEPATEVPRVC